MFSDAGFWTIVKSGVVVRNKEQALAYRAMIARLRQGEDVIVPLCDLYKPVRAKGDVASAMLASTAPLRATTVTISVTDLDIAEGNHFSIDDRLHLITRVVSGPIAPPMVNPIAWDLPFLDEPWVDDVDKSANYTVDILPPVRATHGIGKEVSFSDLKVRCVIQDIDDGDLELDLGRFGQPSLTLIESI